ncbi:MAG TPA: hypothetical protein VFE58_03475 [Tepidisphaeraceae bacterium]|jgi:hypothetical protein|nr:hypothetical protein [Tepidisphaeraceae bacterium]
MEAQFLRSAVMTQFNPLAGSILQSSQVARQQAATKSAQIRRAQLLERNVAQRDDEMEHQVESSEELTPTHDRQDDEGQPGKQKQRKDGEDDKPHVDLTA